MHIRAYVCTHTAILYNKHIHRTPQHTHGETGKKEACLTFPSSPPLLSPVFLVVLQQEACVFISDPLPPPPGPKTSRPPFALAKRLLFFLHHPDIRQASLSLSPLSLLLLETQTSLKCRESLVFCKKKTREEKKRRRSILSSLPL